MIKIQYSNKLSEFDLQELFIADKALSEKNMLVHSTNPFINTSIKLYKEAIVIFELLWLKLPCVI